MTSVLTPEQMAARTEPQITITTREVMDPKILRPGETAEQYAMRTGHLTSSMVSGTPVTATPAPAPVNPPGVKYSYVNVPSKIPYLSGPTFSVNLMTRTLYESKSSNPEVEFASRLFRMPRTEIERVRANVAALRNIDAAQLQQDRYKAQQATLAAKSPAQAYAASLKMPPTLSATRMAAMREQQIREAKFAASGADISFYDEMRRFRPSELQEQEMAERRGEASANQVYASDGGDVATYANGQAVAPPGGVGVPRPGDGAPGGAAALVPLGLLALLFLA